MFFFFSSRRRHTRLQGDWSSDVCSSDLESGEERSYTPDYLATSRGSPLRKPARPLLFEVKYLDELRDRWSDLEAGFRAARMVCAQRRWGFQVVDERDRKSTRLNSSHLVISYAVFCLKKKNT